MIVTPNPASPPPVIAPSSRLGEAELAAPVARMPPRMEKPMPAAISVMKHRRRRFAPYEWVVPRTPSGREIRPGS